ncbi:hypothetical protein [Mycobacteroides salmoniphilum]|uniref:hypothetical protein n=1 Tax=Mycobacteroides salmoniphilum TaxID=404941 RepID=UPI00099317F7|nr:hypothetical protein [Mycobacteroides salmoniphilum]
MSAVLEWVAALSGPSGVVIGAVGKGWMDKRKSPAEKTKIDVEAGFIGVEAAQIIAATAVSLIAPVEGEMNKLVKRVEVLERENLEAKSKFQVAIDHIRSLYLWIDRHLPNKTPPSLPTALEVTIDFP